MKKVMVAICLSMASFSASAQFVAKMQVKEPIDGLCNANDVYALLSALKGQVPAVSPVSNAAITDLLNTEVSFLKENSSYNDKGMIGLVINCEGKVVKCQMDNKTKSPELDKQIEAVFASLGEWKAGTLNKKKVDTSRLFSFTIKDGRFSLQ